METNLYYYFSCCSDFLLLLCFRRKRNQRNPRRRKKSQKNQKKNKRRRRRKKQRERKNQKWWRRNKWLLHRHRHRHRPRLCSKCSCIARVALARFVAPSKDSQVGPTFFTQHPLLIRGIISEPTRVCLSLGVEEVLTDCKSHNVVIKGEKADPLKVLERIQRKSHRKVELLSPIPKPPEEKKVPEEEKPKPKVQEKVQEVCFFLHCLPVLPYNSSG